MADDNSSAPVEQGAGERPAIRRPWLLLGGALAIGFAGIALMFGQPPGVGYALAALLTAVIWVAVGFALGIRPSTAGLILIALILFYSAMVAVRASPALLVLNVLMGFGLALLMAAIYLPGRLARMSLTDYAIALVMSGLALVYQPFLLLFSDLPRVERTPGKRRRLAPVLWGVALAVPLLLVFGALFAAADAVFANFLQGMFAWVQDYPQLLARLILSLILSWLALGLARRAFTARMTPPALEDYANLDFLHLGAPTAITALALVDLLFLGFVLVQAVYLFGGSDTLARTGLTYSEYARRGFFELVTVADAGPGPDPVDGLADALCDGPRPADHQPAARRADRPDAADPGVGAGPDAAVPAGIRPDRAAVLHHGVYGLAGDRAGVAGGDGAARP